MILPWSEFILTKRVIMSSLFQQFYNRMLEFRLFKITNVALSKSADGFSLFQSESHIFFIIECQLYFAWGSDEIVWFGGHPVLNSSRAHSKNEGT